MSKSGRTTEVLFYKTFLKDIFFKNKLSLKGRVSIFTSSFDNPLSIWAKSEGCSIHISALSLPGRFSFFTLNGLLLSQVYNQDCKISKTPFEILEFFTAYYQTKKEILCCSFDSRLKDLNHWLELSWSESLFKKGAIKPIPLFRSITSSDLVHGYIEELVFKKDQISFLGLDIVSSKPNDYAVDLESLHPYHIQNQVQKNITKLLKTHKIPYLFIKLSLKNTCCLSEFVYTFYKVIFCLAQISKSDVLIQPFVDEFKKSGFENKIKE